MQDLPCAWLSKRQESPLPNDHFSLTKKIFYLIHMNIQNASILKDRKKKKK